MLQGTGTRPRLSVLCLDTQVAEHGLQSRKELIESILSWVTLSNLIKLSLSILLFENGEKISVEAKSVMYLTQVERVAVSE